MIALLSTQVSHVRTITMSVCYNLHVETVATVLITLEVSVATDVIGAPQSAIHASFWPIVKFVFFENQYNSHTIC